MIMKLTNPARMFNNVFYPCNPSIHPKAYSKYVDKHVNHMAYKRLAQKKRNRKRHTERKRLAN